MWIIDANFSNKVKCIRKIIMKLKLVLYSVILVFMFGCSPDIGWDGTFIPSNKTYFLPPSWIQGVWTDQEYHGFNFTNNDFIVSYDYTSGHGVSYNERINILSTKFLSCTEQFEPTEYHITILLLSFNTRDYNFKKVSENEIICHYESNIYDEITIEDYSLTKR